MVVYAVLGFTGRSLNFAPSLFDGDLLNFVVPTRLVGLGGSWFSSISIHFRASDAERGAYVGLPSARHRRLVPRPVVGARARAWFLAAALAVGALVTLGTGVAVRGKIRLWLPWSARRAPAAVRQRAAGADRHVHEPRRGGDRGAVDRVAAGLDRPGSSLRSLSRPWCPRSGGADYRMHPERWAFFTSGIYKQCILRNESVAIFPFGFWGSSMLWQAETDFWFRMPEGYLLPDPPPADLANPVVRELTYTDQHPTMDAAARVRHGPRRSTGSCRSPMYVYPDGNQMHRFGAIQGLDGVLVSPACGYPSMQTGIHPTRSTRPGTLVRARRVRAEQALRPAPPP